MRAVYMSTVGYRHNVLSLIVS